jgi:hypothetical protein
MDNEYWDVEEVEQEEIIRERCAGDGSHRAGDPGSIPGGWAAQP